MLANCLGNVSANQRYSWKHTPEENFPSDGKNASKMESGREKQVQHSPCLSALSGRPSPPEIKPPTFKIPRLPSGPAQGAEELVGHASFAEGC